MRRVRPLSSLAAFLAAMILVVLGVPTGATAAGLPITGTGSTWSQNAIDQWKRNVNVNYGMTVNYTGVGSTTGRRDFIDDRVDFAVSEIPFQRSPQDNSTPEIPSRGYAYMPIVAGGTAFMYHLKIGGKKVTNLRLSGATISKIFTGAITNWNHAEIAADNPGLTLPDKAIVPVVRSDGSGTSAQFSLWMSKQHPDIWTQGMTSQFPSPSNGKEQNGSLGVAGNFAKHLIGFQRNVINIIFRDERRRLFQCFANEIRRLMNFFEAFFFLKLALHRFADFRQTRQFTFGAGALAFGVR